MALPMPERPACRDTVARPNPSKWNRILLGLEWISRDGGQTVGASFAQIGQAAGGERPGTVVRYLNTMEARGLIRFELNFQGLRIIRLIDPRYPSGRAPASVIGMGLIPKGRA